MRMSVEVEAPEVCSMQTSWHLGTEQDDVKPPSKIKITRNRCECINLDDKISKFDSIDQSIQNRFSFFLPSVET